MMIKLQNSCIFIAFVLLFIDFTKGIELFEGNVCQLHTGDAGICKNAENCKWLVQNLQRRKMKFSDIRRCSFAVNEEIVCCGDEHPSSTEPQITSPCEFGNANCSPDNNPGSITNPSVTTKFSGSKMNAACQRYMVYATELSIVSIINGEVAYPTEFPHMVALGYLNDKNEYDFDCGASLIADRWLVTAAHCVRDRRKPVMARMGRLDLQDEEESIAIDRNITRIVRHPDYINSRKKNDIALIEFEGDVEFNGDVHPACIRIDPNDVAEDVELTIAGWGTIEADRTNRSKVLLKANLNIVPLESCNQTLVKYNQLSNQPSLRGLSNSQMCALNRVIHSDACQGDSGGPLFIRHLNGMSTLLGIISFGVSCGTDLPGVYTRIASYIDWMENTIWP